MSNEPKLPTDERGNLTVTVNGLQLDAEVVPNLRRIQATLEAAAHEVLLEEPEQAVDLALAANLLIAIRVHAEIAIDRHEADVRAAQSAARAQKRETKPGKHETKPGKPETTTKPEPQPGKRIKHVRDLNGMCSVEHEPGRVCGYIFKRKPRSGSVAAAEQQAADHTIHLPFEKHVASDPEGPPEEKTPPIEAVSGQPTGDGLETEDAFDETPVADDNLSDLADDEGQG